MHGNRRGEKITMRLVPLAAPASAREASLQRIYDSAPIGLAFLSPDCRYLQINQRLTEICGMSVEDHLGRTVRECVPELANAVEAIVEGIMMTGEPVTGIEVAGQRPDEAGQQRSWITYWHPVHGEHGEIIGINVAAEEITERKRAEAALRASEQQLRTLANSIPQLVWMSAADGGIFWFNDYLFDFAAVADEFIAGLDWLAALGPDAGHRQWAQCLAAGAPFERELELRKRDGEQRAFLTRIIPLRDPAGRLYRWVGTHIDISEQKQREDHIRLVVDEMSHRTKNLLAVIMAIASQTARHARTVPDYHERFAERLAALDHSNDLIVSDNWNGASLSELVATQLKPFSPGDSRIEANGPALTLRPKAVQYLGLALHELATNASKHGALSAAGGHVAIEWSADADAHLIQLLWRESDGPAVSAPRRRGFGHVVIEQIVPRSLKGTGRLDFAPEGLRWTFAFPDHDEAEAGARPGWPGR